MEPAGKQEKTKYKLAASMKECMKQMPVDKITVKNIVEGCGVARQTFYRNFLDKYDLINWYFDKLVLQSFEQIGMGHTVGESLTQKFEFIVDEKVFFTEAFRSDDRNSLKEHDFELILQFYQDLIGRKDQQTLGRRSAVPFGNVLQGLCVYDSKMGPYRNERLTGENVKEAGGSYASKTGCCI